MKRILFILLIFLFATGSLLAQNPKTYSKGGFIISQLNLEPNPPEVGDQGVRFLLTDSKMQPILDATIEVEAFMPEMGSMPRMSTKGMAEHEGEGIYFVELEVSMGGSWELPIRITKENGSIIEFPFNYTIDIEGLIYKGREGTDRRRGASLHQHGRLAHLELGLLQVQTPRRIERRGNVGGHEEEGPPGVSR